MVVWCLVIYEKSNIILITVTIITSAAQYAVSLSVPPSSSYNEHDAIIGRHANTICNNVHILVNFINLFGYL